MAGRPPVSATCFGTCATPIPDCRLAVTENGAAFTDLLIDGRVADDRRITYLTEHLNRTRRPWRTASMCSPTSCGPPSTTWSGTTATPRFGVIHVDYDTMARTPKDSALWLREVIDASRPADAS